MTALAIFTLALVVGVGVAVYAAMRAVEAASDARRSSHDCYQRLVDTDAVAKRLERGIGLDDAETWAPPVPMRPGELGPGQVDDGSDVSDVFPPGSTGDLD